MAFWTDEYPHNVWINILTFKGKFLDYKIGESERDWQTWTMRWNDEILNNKEEIKTINFYVSVNNSDEHENAFHKGGDFVNYYINNFGKYNFGGI